MNNLEILMEFATVLLNVAIIVFLLTGTVAKNLQNFIAQQRDALEKGLQRLENTMKGDAAAARKEAADAAKSLREEITLQFNGLSRQTLTAIAQQTEQQKTAGEDLRNILLAQIKDMSQQEKERSENFSKQTGELLVQQFRQTSGTLQDAGNQQKNLLDSFSKQLSAMTQMNEEKLEKMRATVESKLAELQKDNSAKLEQMRATVDEKLHATLEKRLGESFKLVSDRLEQVQKGLGEMQTLATGVGDLKKVLTNVKTRGTMGELQLEKILEQILSPEQYRAQVAVKPGSQERVDFAIELPGADQDAQSKVWLPIDAKFPLEDYQRLVDAEEAGNAEEVNEAKKMLETRIRQEAKSIQEKYIMPPQTTDFALLFLPIEGLYAEVLRRQGLWEELQRKYRVVVTGPTTITALLNSLQMGFRTLAIQKRSSEVWQVLGAVKTEFGKFGEILEKTQKKLKEAAHTIENAGTRSRA
ncbi:MAG: DNA recombination protein RmuC, partial [Firmicutes bacterium]|nr:DNA recombination protein RmuC [Bacillota bacterium]